MVAAYFNNYKILIMVAVVNWAPAVAMLFRATNMVWSTAMV